MFHSHKSSLHSPSPSPFRKASPTPMLRHSNLILTKRYCRILFFALFCSTFLFFFVKMQPSETLPTDHSWAGLDSDLVMLPPAYPSPPTPEQEQRLPPLFEAWKEYERNLSQHARDDGLTKFVYMKNHVWGSGWGNVLQEMLLNTHLAYLSGRSFVFDNYTWDRSESEYSSFNGKTISSRVPASAMLAGPIIGGSFNPSYFTDPFFDVDPSPESHPLAVSSEYYERVCSGQKLVLDTATVRDAVASWDGRANLEAWVNYLQSLPERCVEFELEAAHIFNIWMFGSPQILTLWPSLSQSPVIKQFTHSPLILGAFERNRHLLAVTDAEHREKSKGFFSSMPSLNDFWSDVFFSSSKPSPSPPSPPPPLSLVPLRQLPLIYPHAPATPNINDTIPGLVVLHIRRGDFAQHCVGLVGWGSAFNGFNSFDDVSERDGFDAAVGTPPSNAPTEPEGESELAARIEGMSEEEKEQARKAYKDSHDAYAAKEEHETRKEEYEVVKANYLARCFPDISQIVHRVRQIREEVALQSETLSRRPNLRFPYPRPSSPSAPLTHLYIMTNGKPPFLAELRAALEADAIDNNPLNLPPWESIYTSRDLELGWEEGYVGQALDMYIAQRAEVFVGNGFSSLTSNIVSLRKANGVESVKTRLW